jgi:anti-anti-sigma factor
MDGRIRFAISQEVLPNARVVTISGEFDSPVAEEAGPVLMAASSDPDRVLVIDLTACEFLDSTAIALIVGAARPLILPDVELALASALEIE